MSEGYRWEPVATAARARLLDCFGFDQRPLARPALLCEAIAAIQSVRGVAWVDVDNFGGIPATFVDPQQNGKRVLVTQGFITDVVGTITGAHSGTFNLKPAETPAQRVEAGRAELEGRRS